MIEIDWVFVVCVLLPCCGLWALAGFEICRVTHRQRGIEIDRPITDLIPDYPPEDWSLAPTPSGSIGEAAE